MVETRTERAHRPRNCPSQNPRRGKGRYLSSLTGARILIFQAAQQTANSIPTTLSFLPQILVVPILRIYVTTQEYILNTPPAEIAPLEIVSYMGVVFLAWKMRRLEPFMRKWFLHRPVSLGGTRNRFAESVTLLTSVVSPLTFLGSSSDKIVLTSIFTTLCIQFHSSIIFRRSGILVPC